MKQTPRQKRAANRRRQRKANAEPTATEGSEDAAMVYWTTPKVWSRRCTVCGCKGSEAYRHFDQTSLCAVCVEQLGAEVRESRATRRQRERRAA